MVCQNCGDMEANIKYTQIVNGVKKEMVLCEQCANELGIGKFDFNIPINFSSFLGEFLENDETEFLPSFTEKTLQCKECGMTYSEFINTGKFGCANCYHVFAERIDPILKNLQGDTMHVGRKGKIDSSSVKAKIETHNTQKVSPDIEKENQLKNLKEELKKSIKEEKYEQAAKLRDEIKKLEEKQ